VLGLIAFIYRICAPAAEAGDGSILAPLRIGAFRRVLAGRLASTFGDWLAMTAIVTWTFTQTRSTAAVSAFLIAMVAAGVVGSGVAAPLLDRFSGFRVLAFVETARGAVTAMMIPLAANGSVMPVAALVCVSSFLGAATGPSARSLVPDVVPDDQLQRANSLHGVARNATMVGGSLVAAISVIDFGITTALSIDLATFAVAAALYARFRFLQPAMADAPRHSLRSIAGMIATRRTAVGLISSFTLATAAIGMLNASLPNLLWTRFGQANGYGYAIAAIGLGLMAGELLSGFIRHDMIVRRSVPIAFTVSAMLISLLAESPLLTTVLLALVLLGVADGVTEITYDTLLQRDIPTGSRAAAFAFGSAVQNAGMVAGLGAASLFAASHTAAVVAAAACLVAVPLAALGLLRRPDLAHAARASAEPAATGPATGPAAPAGDPWETSAAALLRRIAGVAGVHIYELDLFDSGGYRCRVWVGDAVESLLDTVPAGVDPEEAWERCVHPDDRPAYLDTLARQRRGEPTELEYRLCGYAGSERWVWERCHPRRLQDGRVRVDGIVTDITRRRRLQQELTEARDRLAALAYTDTLTGLPNRLHFSGRLDEAVAKAAAGGTAFGVLFIDLDGFKQVNDRLGHAAGDRLLAAAARRLHAVTPGCSVARLGGDEFLVLLPHAADAETASEQARQLRNRVAASLSRAYTIEHPVVVGASVGVGVYPLDASDSAGLVRHADAAMYSAKHGVPQRAAA